MNNFLTQLKRNTSGRFDHLDLGDCKISIQAGVGKYSEPRDEVPLPLYSTFEVAFLKEDKLTIPAIFENIMCGDKVLGYQTVSQIEYLIDCLAGGIFSEEHYYSLED